MRRAVARSSGGDPVDAKRSTRRRLATLGLVLVLSTWLLGVGPSGAAPAPSVTVKCSLGDSTTASWRGVRFDGVAIAWRDSAGTLIATSGLVEVNGKRLSRLTPAGAGAGSYADVDFYKLYALPDPEWIIVEQSLGNPCL